MMAAFRCVPLRWSEARAGFELLQRNVERIGEKPDPRFRVRGILPERWASGGSFDDHERDLGSGVARHFNRCRAPERFRRRRNGSWRLGHRLSGCLCKPQQLRRPGPSRAAFEASDARLRGACRMHATTRGDLMSRVIRALSGGGLVPSWHPVGVAAQAWVCRAPVRPGGPLDCGHRCHCGGNPRARGAGSRPSRCIMARAEHRHRPPDPSRTPRRSQRAAPAPPVPSGPCLRLHSGCRGSTISAWTDGRSCRFSRLH